jgi:beta-lactamase class A
VHRRAFLAALAAGATAWLGFGSSAWAEDAEAAFATQLRKLEQGQGRLGVAIVDSASGRMFAYRQDERFMLLSTFKLLAAALVLARVDRGDEHLTRIMPYDHSDMLPGSPVTSTQLPHGGMTIDALCAAAIATSDNTAGNLILSSFGGPQALTGFLRQIGDDTTRLDRFEPALNQALALQPQFDTTTPRAMATTLQKLLTGNVLSAAGREQLLLWLAASETGGKRLKAGLPADWRIGDKTGSSDGDVNDVAIVFPPGRSPLLVAAFLAGSASEPSWKKEPSLAGIGKLLTGL